MADRRPRTRSYRSRGVDVEIRERKDHVEVTLDGVPIRVDIVDGEYHSQLANQFTAFASVDEVVDTLLANEGRTWTLRGHICDERCGPAGHHHEGPHHHDHGDHGHR
jgi:hypothetical protein